MTNKLKAHSGAKSNVLPSTIPWRFTLVVVAIVFVFAGIGARAAYIQVIEPDQLIKQGDNRSKRVRQAAVHRGLIVDRNGQELAVSIPVQAIWADPKVIAQKNSLQDTRRWEALAKVLNRDTESLMARVSNPKRRFVYLQRQVTPAMANYVDALDIPGVNLKMSHVDIIHRVRCLHM